MGWKDSWWALQWGGGHRAKEAGEQVVAVADISCWEGAAVAIAGMAQWLHLAPYTNPTMLRAHQPLSPSYPHSLQQARVALFDRLPLRV
jgi:hypothetical protein